MARCLGQVNFRTQCLFLLLVHLLQSPSEHLPPIFVIFMNCLNLVSFVCHMFLWYLCVNHHHSRDCLGSYKKYFLHMAAAEHHANLFFSSIYGRFPHDFKIACYSVASEQAMS